MNLGIIKNKVLPKPGKNSLEHSRRVEKYIALKIKNAGGSISFAEYMHEVL